MLSFETALILLRGGVVDAQELVGRGHHVDAVGPALSTFLIHKLVHRIIGRGLLKDHTHYQEQCPAQSRGSAFGDVSATDFHLSRLVRQNVNTCKGYQDFFRVEPAHIADLSHELEAEGRPCAEHPHHNWVLRQRRRQGLHFVAECGQCRGNGPELGHRLIHQEPGSLALWHDAKVPTGGGIDVQSLVLAEVVAMLLAPFLVLSCKCFFRQPADTLAERESSYKIHPPLSAIRP